MLSKLDDSKLKLLAFTSRLVEYRGGDYLFRKDDPADDVYLIMQGEAEVMAKPDCDGEACTEKVILTRTSGDLIGEMAVISKQGRSAAIRARDGLKVLRIEGDMFVKLLTSNSDVALDVMRQLSDKLAEAQETNNLLQRQLATQVCGGP
ncbi:cyclic nucleotide-binding domain-containing protein [Motiliproteus sp.]|uniref:cyclic nucleotide-binding domain-containing protein n=1 Tax=Motiliproteus sp. TaxID=1898955 RepID=UPI003BA986F1